MQKAEVIKLLEKIFYPKLDQVDEWPEFYCNVIGMNHYLILYINAANIRVA